MNRWHFRSPSEGTTEDLHDDGIESVHPDIRPTFTKDVSHSTANVSQEKKVKFVGSLGIVRDLLSGWRAPSRQVEPVFGSAVHAHQAQVRGGTGYATTQVSDHTGAEPHRHPTTQVPDHTDRSVFVV